MTDLRSPDLGDLALCAQEPIHIPGAVQAHGVLLAATEDDRVVRVVSANCASLLGTGPDGVLGHPLDDVVPRDLLPEDLSEVSASGEAGYYPSSATQEVPAPVDAVLHRSDGLVVVELEPGTGPRAMADTYRLTRSAIGRINRATEPDDLYRIAVEEVRRLTGFDRVMVYRFDEDWNGEVVAEEKDQSLNSYHGLRYPASDIPAQARELYRRNWVRLIPDVGYEPVPLVPDLNPLTGAPLDLSHSTLRSVSPVHIEYLGNMGVAASMSISLLGHGELWGLIACHHYSGPHRPSYGTRAAVEFLGQLLSLRLVESTREQETRHAARARAALVSLKAAVQVDTRPAVRALTGGYPTVLDLVPAEGAAVALEGEDASVGAVPPPEAVHALVQHARASGYDVLALDRVPTELPSLDQHRDVACGALVMRLSDEQYVVWFRPELVRVVSWGGDPRNTKIARDQGESVRISPRKSFERWQEVVRGRSAPWSPADVKLVTDLRHDLIDARYTRAHRLAVTAATLQRSMMPDRLPDLPGWELAADYRPSVDDDVGGDWYDVFTLSSGEIVCVLGDVAGHGVTAAGTMAQLRNGLRAYLVEDNHPAPALERLSRLMEQLLPEVFATATLVVLDPDSGRTQITSAGHPPPALVSPGGKAVLVGVTPGAPLGTFPAESTFPTVTSFVEPGGSLVLYSDGLVERRDEAIDVGLDRLVRLCSVSAAPADLCARLISDCRDPDSGDDATVLVIQRAPGGAGR